MGGLSSLPTWRNQRVQEGPVRKTQIEQTGEEGP